MADSAARSQGGTAASLPSYGGTVFRRQWPCPNHCWNLETRCPLEGNWENRVSITAVFTAPWLRWFPFVFCEFTEE